MSIADKAKGKLKEAVGSVTGSVDLRREGKAQWHKGHHQAQADEARAMAEKHELEANLFEHEERRNRRIRDDVPGDVPGESQAEHFEHEERRNRGIRDDVPGDVPGQSRPRVPDVPGQSRPRVPRDRSSHGDRAPVTGRRDLDR